MEGVIEERIGRLAEELRAALTVASVEGEQFTAEVVAQVRAMDARDLVRRLSENLQKEHRLVSAQGLRRLATRRLALYRFQHNLFQKYLYNGMDAVERAYLHEDVGNVLEALYGEQSDEVAVQLARHFEEAGLTDKAARYLRRAGELAAARYANEEALFYFGRALALLARPAAHSPELAADLYHHLGDTLHRTAQHDKARTAFQQAIAANPTSDSLYQAELHRKIGNSWRDQYRYPEALLAYADAQHAREPIPSEPSLEWWHAWIQVLLEINLVYYWLGHVSESDQLRVEAPTRHRATWHTRPARPDFQGVIGTNSTQSPCGNG